MRKSPAETGHEAMCIVTRTSFKSFLQKTGILIISLFLLTNAKAQNLTISGSGQTGTSGSNWSTTGSNPVTITVTGVANINASVILGYLNAGTSVLVNNTSLATTINVSINKTSGAAASLTFKDIGNIKVAGSVSISSTSNPLNIILWADSDLSQGGAVDDFISIATGCTFESAGGKIVMAGGPDNGSNGGVLNDGIPDGFAWNGSNLASSGASTVGGLTLGPLASTGTLVSLSSSGGEIILRGSTSNSNTYPGITSQGNLKIVSGAGKITMYGKSTTGHGIELTYGALPAIAISSSSTSTPAIDIKGSSNGANGFWASNNAAGNVLIQSSSATGGGVSVEGTSSTGSGIVLGTSGTGLFSQILSQSGTVTFRGKGASNLSMNLYGDVYVGNRKDANPVSGVVPVVTASTANIMIQGDDQLAIANGAGKVTSISSLGALSIESYTAGYSGTVSWTGNPAFGTTFSGITLGKSTENYSFLLNNTLTTPGNITAYTSSFTLANGIGLVSTGAGNISINANGNFNTTGTTRRTISTVNGSINILADADGIGGGLLDIDYLTLNPGTGNIRMTMKTVLWNTAASTDKPYINGTGSFIIEPVDASFQAIQTDWFVFDQDLNGISGLTIGKSTNTGDITIINSPLVIAGPVSLYGGIVNLNSTLTSSASGDIFIKANTNVSSGGSIAATSTIFKTGGTGTLTMQSQARLNTGTVTAVAPAVLNVVLWSDYTNLNNGGVELRSITTNGGHLWAGGSTVNAGSNTWNGLTVGDGPSVGSVNNNYNALDFFGPISTNGGDVLLWAGAGYSSGISGLGILTAPGIINAGAGNVTLIADNISTNDLSVTSTGVLSLLPDGGSYPADITWSGIITGGNFNGSNKYDNVNIINFPSLGGLSIGYYDGQLSSGSPLVQVNTSNVTVAIPTSIAGSIRFYATSLAVNQNLISTGGKNITLSANALSIATGMALTSTGKLTIEPITAATTVGLTGGAGSLAVTATNFNSNFSDGFSEIQIGNAATGNITLATAIIAKDNLRMITTGSLSLNETMELGNNNFRFIGTGIVPATGKYIKTNGAGQLMIDLANNNSRLFPVGVTDYNPVTITNRTGISNTFYATASTGIYFGGGTNGTLVGWSPRVDLTWNIGNVSGVTAPGNVDLAFGWNAANVVGPLSTARLAHYNGTSWEQLPSTPVVNLAAGTLTYSGYTGGFSPFGIAEENISLPVTWISFTGNKLQNNIALQWTTSSERNNNYFDVERQAPGAGFTNIGRIAAARQGQTENNHYNFIDHHPLAGIGNYRLKQVDLDGRISYSKIIGVGTASTQPYRIAATPGTQQMVVSTPQNANLRIYDVNGRQLLQQQIKTGSNTIKTDRLPAGGVYIVNIMQGNTLLYTTRFSK